MNDLSYEIGEVRALAESLTFLDMNDEEVFRRTSPYLIRVLNEKADELERKYGELCRAVGTKLDRTNDRLDGMMQPEKGRLAA